MVEKTASGPQNRGMIGEGRSKTSSPTPRVNHSSGGFFNRRRLATSLLAVGFVLILAVLLVPTDGSQATPTRTGGNCQGSSGTCHPQTSTQFLTVTGFPAGSYTPGNVYRITVSIADGNGATGENHMNFIVSAGTVSNGDANVIIQSATQAIAGVNSVSSWSFDWTAPTSGAVSADAWGVYGSGNGKSDPYDHRTLSTAEIPEFATLVIPIVGALGLLLMIRHTRRKKQSSQ